MARTFTDKAILNLKGRDKKYYEREGRGFAVRVMPSGVRTFLYIYTINGKRRELDLGEYPYTKLVEARQKYQDAYSLVTKGIDPKEHNKAIEKAKDKAKLTTFKHFADLYLEWSEKNHVLAYYRSNKLALNSDILPYWEAKQIADIKRRDAIELLERVAKRAKGQLHNVLKAAKGVFEYALQREYIEANPMSNLSKAIPDLKNKPARDRNLTDSEIKHVWSAIKNCHGDTRTKAALKLVLVTAQRPGEVAQLHRKQIEGEWWAIPPEVTKNGKEHLVYLTPTALELIGDAEGFIFPSWNTEKDTEKDAEKAMRRDTLSGVVARADYYSLPRWTPHDLRRTARTMMARLQVPPEHAEAVLNHAKPGMIKIYDRHDYQEEKKAALIKWEAELLRIVS